MSSRKTRPAAVAGRFYEADDRRLRHQITGLMGGAPAQAHHASADNTRQPRALIVPHAGYIYSGATAAVAYGCLEACRRRYRRVALFGPAHRVYLPGMAVPSVAAFETPLGEVELDRAAIAALTDLPGVAVWDAAHRDEHSLEVQLPFLQFALGPFTLVPVLVGDCDRQQVARAMDLLCADRDTLLVLSSDLSHFHHYEHANAMDQRTCERLLAKSDNLDAEEACGARVLNGLMASQMAKDLQVELLERCNSGDTAGDRESVVGYGAFVLH